MPTRVGQIDVCLVRDGHSVYIVALVISVDVVTAGDLAAITSELALVCRRRPAEHNTCCPFLPLHDGLLVLFLVAAFSGVLQSHAASHSTGVLFTGHVSFPCVLAADITRTWGNGSIVVYSWLSAACACNHNWAFIEPCLCIFTLYSPLAS